LNLWPLGIALIVLWGVTATMLRNSLGLTGGELTYALDDAYIHMALAKNLAEHGVWGVTPYGFSSAVSSLLWPVLIAVGYWLGGVNLWVPTLLNGLFGSALLAACFWALAKQPSRPHGLVILVTLLAVIALPPLPVNMLIGMEHVLHMLVMVPAIYLAARLVAAPDGEHARSDQRWLLGLGALLPLVRYEGLFMVLAMCLLLALRRRLGFAVLLGLTSLVPVGAFAVYSLAQGWYALPNSVLIKGTTPEPSNVLWMVKHAFGTLMYSSHLLGVMLLAAAFLVGRIRTDGLKTPGQASAALFLLTAVQHLLFASVDWYFRYEAYLMAWGALTVAISLAEVLRLESPMRRKAWVAVAQGMAIIVVLFVISPSYQARLQSLANIPSLWYYRAEVSTRIMPGTAKEKQDQHVQMGRFLNAHYAGETIAANDIGAITYFSQVRLVDLMGLADLDAAKLIRGKQMDRAGIERLCAERGAKIALIQEQYFAGRIPESWVRVGQWQFKGYGKSDRGKVAFYAIDPAERDALEARLKAYTAHLPERVLLLLDRTERPAKGG
jgi:hypothetical protein